MTRYKITDQLHFIYTVLPQEALYYKVKTRRRQDKQHIETEREKQLYK